MVPGIAYGLGVQLSLLVTLVQSVALVAQILGGGSLLDIIFIVTGNFFHMVTRGTITTATSMATLNKVSSTLAAISLAYPSSPRLQWTTTIGGIPYSAPKWQLCAWPLSWP
jgi:hypothetical protein